MRFRDLSIVTTVVTYLTILVGGFTRGSGAGLGCDDNWPRCTETSFFPDWSNSLMVIEWSHRFVALLAGIAILTTAVVAWRSQRHDRRVLVAATIAAVLLPIQAYLGALTVWNHLDPVLSATHMGTAAALFGAVVATAIFAFYPERPAPTGPGSGSGEAEPKPPAPSKLREYATMMKPRIMALLVAMGVTGIVLAPDGLALSPVQAFVTLAGGALAAGAGGIINQVIERDLDARMARTRDRPLPNGRIPPGDALAVAMVLIAVSFTAIAWLVNVLTAVLTLLAVLLYVFVYTLWLKPTTPQAVVVGGAAGSAPALVGWAAVTGEIGTPALLLGALVFLWQPPHFWALAIFRQNEYGAAGFPMMPNVRGLAATKRSMVLYAVGTVALAAAFYVLGYLGTLYLVVSTVLGAGFLWMTLRVLPARGERHARPLFLGSIAYLGLLFAAMVADRLLLA